MSAKPVDSASKVWLMMSSATRRSIGDRTVRFGISTVFSPPPNSTSIMIDTTARSNCSATGVFQPAACARTNTAPFCRRPMRSSILADCTPRKMISLGVAAKALMLAVSDRATSTMPSPNKGSRSSRDTLPLSNHRCDGDEARSCMAVAAMV